MNRTPKFTFVFYSNLVSPPPHTMIGPPFHQVQRRTPSEVHRRSTTAANFHAHAYSKSSKVFKVLWIFVKILNRGLCGVVDAHQASAQFPFQQAEGVQPTRSHPSAPLLRRGTPSEPPSRWVQGIGSIQPHFLVPGMTHPSLTHSTQLLTLLHFSHFKSSHGSYQVRFCAYTSIPD
jgi:hypothetical protein